MQREISLETSTRARERPCNSISRCKNDEWMIGRVKLHSTVPTQANSFGLVVAKRRTLTTYHIFFAICDSSFFSILPLCVVIDFEHFVPETYILKDIFSKARTWIWKLSNFPNGWRLKSSSFPFSKSKDTFSLLKHLSCMYNLYRHLFPLPHQLISIYW